MVWRKKNTVPVGEKIKVAQNRPKMVENDRLGQASSNPVLVFDFDPLEKVRGKKPISSQRKKVSKKSVFCL